MSELNKSRLEQAQRHSAKASAALVEGMRKKSMSRMEIHSVIEKLKTSTHLLEDILCGK